MKKRVWLWWVSGVRSGQGGEQLKDLQAERSRPNYGLRKRSEAGEVEDEEKEGFLEGGIHVLRMKTSLVSPLLPVTIGVTTAASPQDDHQ